MGELSGVLCYYNESQVCVALKGAYQTMTCRFKKNHRV